MAAFLQAAIQVLKTPGRLRYNVLLLFVSDEEYRFTGAARSEERAESKFWHRRGTDTVKNREVA